MDPVFIRTLIKKLDPAWLRPWPGSNVIRTVDCGGRAELLGRFPDELKAVLQAGGDTTLLVWADVDDLESPDALKQAFWEQAKAAGITSVQFDQVVFAFARKRLENWVEFLNSGKTDESRGGPRVKDPEALQAVTKLAELCQGKCPVSRLPPSLEWSCENWRRLVDRMKR